MVNKAARVPEDAPPRVDLLEAQRFLQLLVPEGDVTFQTFPDSDALKTNSGLIRVLHGRLQDHSAELERLNQKGAGIFFMVNAGDGVVHEGAKTCRTAENVTRIRALFVDLDGAPLGPVTVSTAPPHVVVESSPGKWHAYWLVSDCPPAGFRTLQSALAQKFKGDAKVIDLPRVLRVPGFLHQKKVPFLVRVAEPASAGEVIRAPYTVAGLSQSLGISVTPDAQTTKSPSGVHHAAGSNLLLDLPREDGERTHHLVQLAGTYFARRRSLEEVIALARGWNSRNTLPLSDEKIVATCEGIQKTHLRHHPDEQEPAAGGEVIPLFPLADARIEKFITDVPPPRRWLLKDCLPHGKVGALIAPGGTGKSQFLLQLAASVATGAPFLTWEIGEPGGVLCLFAEDDDEEIHRRLHNIAVRMGSGPDADVRAMKRLNDNLHIKSMVGLDNLMTVADRHTREVAATDYADRLLLVARKIPNLKLIVIDPGSRFRGGDENFAQDTTRFIEVLERVSRSTGANVLVAHHANKGSMGGGEPNQGAQRGSSAFTDGVRWQMNLSYLNEKALTEYRIQSDEKRLYLTAAVVKNNYGPPGVDLLLRRAEDGYLAPADVSGRIADVEGHLLQNVRARIGLEAKAGKTYSRTDFENNFGGAQGPLKIGKTQLRKFLAKWVSERKLATDSKKHLVPDAPMASRSISASDNSASNTKH